MDIQQISGADNVVADAFSPPVDIKAIAESQKDDKELLELLETHNHSLQLEKIKVPGSDVTLICDTSTSQPRPFVPTSERRQVFNSLHGLSPPGSRATAQLVSFHLAQSSKRLSHMGSCLLALPAFENHKTQLLSSPKFCSDCRSIWPYPYRHRRTLTNCQIISLLLNSY